MTPRGIRNANPGNIVAGADWQGLASRSDMTPQQLAESRFAVFKAPEWGIRAMAKVLHAYRVKHGLDTISGIIARWAPSSDGNNVKAYVGAVSEGTGFGADDRLDTTDPDVLEKLITAIIRHENGEQPYDPELIRNGIAMASGARPVTSEKEPKMPNPVEETKPKTPPPGVDEVAGLFRHAITTLGGILVYRGMTDKATVASAVDAADALLSEEVVGAVLTIGGLIWSAWRKISRRLTA